MMAANSFESPDCVMPEEEPENIDDMEHSHEKSDGELCQRSSENGEQEPMNLCLNEAKVRDTRRDEEHPSVKEDSEESQDDDDDDAVPSNEICVGDREGETDLMHAVRLNHCDKIRQLIRSGWDCNAVCKLEGEPCMVRASRGDFSKQLKMAGYASLHVAAIHSSLRTIKCLLSMGAVINIRDKNDRTPLQLAAAVCRPKVAQLLISSGADINTRSLSGRSPLMEAVMNIDLELTRMLLGAGANANLTDIKGTTPLFATINALGGRRPNVETGRAIVRSLIDAGCEVDKCNPAGASALMLASGLKFTSIVSMLLAAGANVNLADGAGRTSFSMAMEGQRNLITAKELMKHGAATDLPDIKGQTPLSKALKYGSVTILRLLMAADAVPHTYDILKAPRIIQLRQILPEFDAWLHNELYEPRSLMRLCREVIRQQMSPHKLPLVEQLGLPRSLNGFVLGEMD